MPRDRVGCSLPATARRLEEARWMWPVIGLLWTIVMFAMCTSAAKDIGATAPQSDLALGMTGIVFIGIWVGGLVVIALLRLVFGSFGARTKSGGAIDGARA